MLSNTDRSDADIHSIDSVGRQTEMVIMPPAEHVVLSMLYISLSVTVFG